MYEELKFRLLNSLRAELDYVAKFEKDKSTKFDKMNDIMHVVKVIENYEEIEPKIADTINELARNKKFGKGER